MIQVMTVNSLVIGFLTAVILLAVYNSPQESRQPVQESELTIQKTWVEIDPIQCLGNPWELDWLKSHNDGYASYPRDVHTEGLDDGETIVIKDYYKNQGITVFDARSGSPGRETAQCEGCGCSAGYTLYLLVLESDFDKMLNLKYKISQEEALQHVGEQVRWKFQPYEYWKCADPQCNTQSHEPTCDGFDCNNGYNDSKCSVDAYEIGRYGFFIKDDGSVVTYKERGILYRDAIIDYSLCGSSKTTSKTPTPRQQITDGVLPDEIICKEGLQLIFKSRDNSPACVKPQTAEKLFERGWGTKEISLEKTLVENYPQAIDIIGTVDYERYRTPGHFAYCEHFTLTLDETEDTNLGNITSNIFTLHKKIDVLPNDAVVIEDPFNKLTEDIKGKKIHVVGSLFKEFSTGCLKWNWDESDQHVISSEKEPNPIIVAKIIDILE